MQALWTCQIAICLSEQAVGPRKFLLRQHAGSVCGVLPISVGFYQPLPVLLNGITDLPLIPFLDQQYTAPQGLPLPVPCTPPSHPPKQQLLDSHPTSSSAFLSAIPFSRYACQQSAQIPSQTASPSVHVQKLSNSPITRAETAAPQNLLQQLTQPPAPSRSNQCLHGIRSADQVQGAMSASFLHTDDKQLCSTTGKNALSAALGGAAAASAAAPGLTHASSSLPAFRLPPPQSQSCAPQGC